MKSLNNYITERLNPRHLGHTGCINIYVNTSGSMRPDIKNCFDNVWKVYDETVSRGEECNVFSCGFQGIQQVDYKSTPEARGSHLDPGDIFAHMEINSNGATTNMFITDNISGLGPDIVKIINKLKGKLIMVVMLNSDNYSKASRVLAHDCPKLKNNIIFVRDDWDFVDQILIIIYKKYFIKQWKTQ